MNEYETRILIEELHKLIVSQSVNISCKDIEIRQLKAEVERLEHLLTPKN